MDKYIENIDTNRKTSAHMDKLPVEEAAEITGDPITTAMQRARQHFKDAKGCHDFEHTLRVIRLCERIGPAENADMTVLLIAASLHDIGRGRQDRSGGIICHAREGAKMAGPFIDDLALSDEQKKNIIHCIATHRFRGNTIPQSIEAKVLFDADKIDAIGAVGIARAYLFAGELGAKLHNPDTNIDEDKAYSGNDTGYREYKVKLCRIKDRILTVEGQKIAAARHDFMVGFFKRFIEEYEGNI